MALAAGATPEVATRIGAAMTLLQLGIGTVNDVVDAEHDRGRKPAKPIPSGIVSPSAARVVAVGFFAAGVAVAGSVGPGLAALAGAVIAIGLAYDLRLKGTAWSWLPFAIGIPILPVFGWFGATGGLHRAFVLVVPAAVASGAALAIANSLVDVERDRAAGRSSIASVLGLDAASRLSAALSAAVGLVAVLSAASFGASPLTIAVLGAGGAIAAAVGLRAGGGTPDARELRWRVQAVAIAVVGVVWVRAVLG